MIERRAALWHSTTSKIILPSTTDCMTKSYQETADIVEVFFPFFDHIFLTNGKERVY